MERIYTHQDGANKRAAWRPDSFCIQARHYKEGKRIVSTTLASITLRKSLFALFLAMFLAGCAASPMQVDLSRSVYQPQQVKGKQLHPVKEIKIINSAKDPEVRGNFSKTYIAIKTQPSTRQTVEDDIRKKLATSFEVSPDSRKSLLVNILQADSYWSQSAMTGGLVTAFADKDFELNLNVTFEVKEGEAVVKSYRFNDKITFKGKATTESDVQESYKSLIELYRRKFFDLLDKEFLQSLSVKNYNQQYVWIRLGNE
jgi:uncharacterized lipoprotein YajG